MDIGNLKAILYKKEGVIEVYDSKKLLKEHILNENDEWFSVNWQKTEWDCNYIDNTLGLYSCYKEKGHWNTGDFEGIINLEIR